MARPPITSRELQKRKLYQINELNGGAGEARTPDLRFRNLIDIPPSCLFSIRSVWSQPCSSGLVRARNLQRNVQRAFRTKLIPKFRQDDLIFLPRIGEREFKRCKHCQHV